LNIKDTIKRIDASNAKIQDFGDLLDTLATTDEKKKMLWKEIYSNATSDRESASVLYTQLFMAMTTSSAQEHSNLGPMLMKYLERMGKSNDQLIKLAEMISDSEKEVGMTPEDVFEAIGN